MRTETMPVPAKRHRSGLFRCAVLALAACTTHAVPASAADPDVLWKIVSGKCVPDQQQHHDPAPCEKVDLTGGVARGYVVLKDLTGATQFLVIPTARVTGIESPALLLPDAPNYWASAWKARRFVLARAHKRLPRDAIGLAVNSVQGRSQNQLHIHVDCIRPDLESYLGRHAARLSHHWLPLGIAFDGHRYLARRLDSPELRGVDPFNVLARGIAAARTDMGNWTLVAVGAKPRGFVLLADHVDPATHDDGSGEELLDHACALAQSRAAGR
jgi:CDP-diacylglycerol pyrophosphatase